MLLSVTLPRVPVLALSTTESAPAVMFVDAAFLACTVMVEVAPVGSGFGEPVMVVVLPAAVLTVMAAVPVRVVDVAVMVAEPSATAVTTPEELTVATPAALVTHVTACPESERPTTSRTVGVSACVAAVFRDKINAVLDGILRRADLQYLAVELHCCLYHTVNAKERLRDFGAPGSD